MILKISLYIAIIITNFSSLRLDLIGLIIKITNLINYLDNGSSFFINLIFNSIFYDEFLKLFGFRNSPTTRITNRTSNTNLNSRTSKSINR